jgi:hypothetical protein
MATSPTLRISMVMYRSENFTGRHYRERHSKEATKECLLLTRSGRLRRTTGLVAAGDIYWLDSGRS